MNTVQKISCAALSAILLCGQAVASHAEAHISDIQWTVIDLTPDDGVAPTFDLNGIAGRSLAEFVTYVPYETSTATGSVFFSPLTRTWSQGSHSQGFASVGPTELKAETSNAPGGSGVFVSAWTNTLGSGPGTLTLAPHSALRLTATGSLNLTRTVEDSWLFAQFDITYGSDLEQRTISRSLSTQLYDEPQAQTSQLHPIEFLITNNSAQALPVSFHFHTSSGAVPEPGTIGLLLAGLAAVAVPRLRQFRATQA